MNLEEIASALWTALGHGVAALQNPATRSKVDYCLRQNGILQNPQDFDARALMKQFFIAFVRDWPNNSTLGWVEPHLEALREMRAAMDVAEINKHVAVFPDPYRMLDNRQKLDEFKSALMELVLHEWEQSPPDEEG